MSETPFKTPLDLADALDKRHADRTNDAACRDTYYAWSADTIRSLETENARLREALARFADLDTTPQANADCEKWRVSFLFACPEYIGYCRQARAALARATGKE